MSQTCAIITCKRPSRALCFCCQQGVCLQHLKEHNEILLSELYPLVDQINSIGDRLKGIDIKNKVGNCLQELEQWRNDCHKKIDDFFEQQCVEINQYVTEKMENQREKINQIQVKIGAHIREEEVSRLDIDLLTSNIEKLNQKINEFEGTRFNIEIRPIMIDNSWIHFEESNKNRFNSLKISSVCKTINYTEKSNVLISSNDRFVLMHQLPDLCLIDRNLKIIHRTIWNYGRIRSMCWSSSLNRFIIVSIEDIFSFDETTMSIEKLKIVEKRNWFSCTCSDTSLFLLTYALASSIVEFNMLPTIEFIKEWKSPDTCQKDEWITDIKYNRGSIALLVNNLSQKTLFIELKHIKTFDRLWSYQIDREYDGKNAFHCCIVNDEDWLLLDHHFGYLLHITKDGKMKASTKYEPSPWCATILGPDLIAISTLDGVKFHEF